MLRNIMLGIALTLVCPFAKVKAIDSNSLTKISITVAGLTESQKVDRLIQYIRGMKGAVFIRNGSEHTCKEAADHLQSKWEKHKGQIKTAEEFIEELASRSGLSGQDYMIRFEDGSETTTNAVLTKELKRLEQL
ncbi:DUF5329 family protein [Pontibacter sp. MBLB2868]|uniref:DUF5329 family protein n=1 Tax=Pontibacter sp. MBLB2868 TaxID=3451555 RepID=UPI003F753DF0